MKTLSTNHARTIAALFLQVYLFARYTFCQIVCLLQSEGFLGRFQYQIISEVAFPKILKFSKLLACRSEDLHSPYSLLIAPAALGRILEKGDLFIFKIKLFPR